MGGQARSSLESGPVKLLAPIVPAPFKRALGRTRERRYLRALAPVVAAYVERNGLVVQGGPFPGMRYPPELAQVPKLTGAYELELHDAIAEWIATPPQIVVDVGCSEGYYAVGLARALPDAQVHAYDIDDRSRELCSGLALLNGVADRVDVRRECGLEELRALPAHGVALFMDCEGCESALLRPDLVAPMAGWRIIVELHDFIRPGLDDEVIARFSDSHEVEVIDERPRGDLDLEPLRFLTSRERATALNEFRPQRMRWAHLHPRA
jgi:hypothetical protein